jgi:hypothetical protein
VSTSTCEEGSLKSEEEMMGIALNAFEETRAFFGAFAAAGPTRLRGVFVTLLVTATTARGVI